MRRTETSTARAQVAVAIVVTVGLLTVVAMTATAVITAATDTGDVAGRMHDPRPLHPAGASLTPASPGASSADGVVAGQYREQPVRFAGPTLEVAREEVAPVARSRGARRTHRQEGARQLEDQQENRS